MKVILVVPTRDESENIKNFSIALKVLKKVPHTVCFVDGSKDNKTVSEIIDTYKNYEEENFFIKFIQDDTKLDFYSVQNTNYCKIKIYNHHSENKLIIVSIIDNLIKGASGQAVQCFNIMQNYKESKALI